MHLWRRRQQLRQPLRAFTLIEILIVVVILGILASIAVVAFGSASRDARESVLREELRFMRTQLAFYRASHSAAAGTSPQTGQIDGSLVADQMTKYTDYYGNVASSRDSVFTFGPCLSEFPLNPFMSSNADKVKILPIGTDPASAVDESTGWIYAPDTLEFYANSLVYGPGSTGQKW